MIQMPSKLDHACNTFSVSHSSRRCACLGVSYVSQHGKWSDADHGA